MHKQYWLLEQNYKSKIEMGERLKVTATIDHTGSLCWGHLHDHPARPPVPAQERCTAEQGK